MLHIGYTTTVLDDLKNTNIITVFMKGDQSEHNSYCGISLVSIVSKIFIRIIWVVAEEIFPESQCIFKVQSA